MTKLSMINDMYTTYALRYSHMIVYAQYSLKEKIKNKKQNILICIVELAQIFNFSLHVNTKLSVTYANNLDTDNALQNVRLDLCPNC